MATVRAKRTPSDQPNGPSPAAANGTAQVPAVLGQRIRRLRTQAGKTLRAQAREIGIAPSSLSALETGHGGVSLKRLQLVAEHFGLHISDLLGEPAAPSGAGRAEIIRNCAATIPGVPRGTGVVYQLLGNGRGHTIQPYPFRADRPHAFRNGSSVGVAAVIGAATPPW
jgi:DNA-binding XRE family transcriptional regulator